MVATPLYSHLSKPIYNSVYPPAEDTFLLLDTLEEELPLLQQTKISLEIGSGSGVVSTFVKILLPHTSHTACDINPAAVQATLETAQLNNKEISAVESDLGSGLEALQGKVDLLIFNPPYVVTDSNEVSNQGIEASWAGGIDGREIIDKFLPLSVNFLSTQGVFYLLGIKQNKPSEICDLAKSYGLLGSIIKEKKAGIEKLFIIKFTKNGEQCNATTYG